MIHSIWILSILYLILTYLLFLPLFYLQHNCYCFNEPTTYRWTLTLSILYIFTIHLSFSSPRIASLTLLLSRVSELFRNYEHCGILYVSVINTHLLPLFYIILSFHSRCSEPLVVGLINTVIIITYLAWGQNIVFGIVIVTWECAV